MFGERCFVVAILVGEPCRLVDMLMMPVRHLVRTVEGERGCGERRRKNTCKLRGQQDRKQDANETTHSS